MGSKVSAWGHYLPSTKINNRKLAKIVFAKSNLEINPETLRIVTGVEERRYAEKNINSSDLAIKALRSMQKRNNITSEQLSDVDLLIFASASQDLIEPATSSIIAGKLDLMVSTFDIKNACNSFLNALQLADALIQSSSYRKILILNGEKPSVSIKLDLLDRKDYKTHFASLSFGDGGSAAIVEGDKRDSFIKGAEFVTDGHYWESGTLPGGGTMNPHDLEATFFRGNAKDMIHGFLNFAPHHLKNFLKQNNMKINDYDAVALHQPMKEAQDIFIKETGIDKSKILSIYKDFGNIAAASIPIALSSALFEGKLKSGDRVLLVGLGGGINLGLMDIFV